MRRAARIMVVGAAVVAVLSGAGPAVAAPSEPAAVASAAAQTVCTVRDERLDELSGLVSVDGGFVAVNDGSDTPSHRRIFFLDEACKVTRAVAFPAAPTDTEDLAVAADGTIWVGDIGSNDAVRQTIGLWELAPGADEPVLHEVRYPDRGHNAETLVLDGDGTPIVVTKKPFGGEVYVPVDALAPGRVTKLRRVGAVQLPITSTSNPFGFSGRLVMTGGATAPDASKVAVRTYADAFEYPVVGGDVAAALTGGAARAVALPDEPQGEAITYSRDGSSLITASEGAEPKLLRHPSAIRTAPAGPPAGTPAAVASKKEPADKAGFPTTGVLAGAGLVVVLLLGMFLASRRRRRRRA